MLPVTTKMTRKQFIEVLQTNIDSQINKFTPESRVDYIQFLLKKPSAQISHSQNSFIDTQTDLLLRFIRQGEPMRNISKPAAPAVMFYSAHDTQISLLWDFLQPLNFPLVSIPFASSV